MFFFFSCYGDHRDLHVLTHSFPTLRSSDLRETEGMRDGTDAVSDWPLLNALLNTAAGATWVSLHHGGGVGMGYSQHAGMLRIRSEEHTSELQSLMRISYAVFCLQKKKHKHIKSRTSETTSEKHIVRQ